MVRSFDQPLTENKESRRRAGRITHAAQDAAVLKTSAPASHRLLFKLYIGVHQILVPSMVYITGNHSSRSEVHSNRAFDSQGRCSAVRYKKGSRSHKNTNIRDAYKQKPEISLRSVTAKAT